MRSRALGADGGGRGRRPRPHCAVRGRLAQGERAELGRAHGARSRRPRTGQLHGREGQGNGHPRLGVRPSRRSHGRPGLARHAHQGPHRTRSRGHERALPALLRGDGHPDRLREGRLLQAGGTVPLRDHDIAGGQPGWGRARLAALPVGDAALPVENRRAAVAIPRCERARGRAARCPGNTPHLLVRQRHGRYPCGRSGHSGSGAAGSYAQRADPDALPARVRPYRPAARRRRLERSRRVARDRAGRRGGLPESRRRGREHGRRDDLALPLATGSAPSGSVGERS